MLSLQSNLKQRHSVLFLYVCIWLSGLLGARILVLMVWTKCKMMVWTKKLWLSFQKKRHSSSYFKLLNHRGNSSVKIQTERNSECLTWGVNYFWHVGRCEAGNEGWQGTQWSAMWNSCHGRSSIMRTQWLLTLIGRDTINVFTRQDLEKQRQSVTIHPTPDILFFYFPISFLNPAQTFYWDKCVRKSPHTEGRCFVFFCCVCGGEDVDKQILPTWVYDALGVSYSWKCSFRGLQMF